MFDSSIASFLDLSANTFDQIYSIIDNTTSDTIPTDINSDGGINSLSKTQKNTPNNSNLKKTIEVKLKTTNKVDTAITKITIQNSFSNYLDLQKLGKTNQISTKDILNYFIHVATWIERKIEIYKSVLQDSSSAKFEIYKNENTLPTTLIQYNTKDIADCMNEFMTRINSAKDTLNPKHEVIFSCSSSSSSSSSSNYIVYMIIK